MKFDQHGRQSPLCHGVVLSSTAFVFITVSCRICSIVWPQGRLQVVFLPLCAVWLRKISVGTVALFTPAIRNRCLVHHILWCPTNELQRHTYILYITSNNGVLDVMYNVMFYVRVHIAVKWWTYVDELPGLTAYGIGRNWLTSENDMVHSPDPGCRTSLTIPRFWTIGRNSSLQFLTTGI